MNNNNINFIITEEKLFAGYIKEQHQHYNLLEPIQQDLFCQASSIASFCFIEVHDVEELEEEQLYTLYISTTEEHRRNAVVEWFV